MSSDEQPGGSHPPRPQTDSPDSGPLIRGRAGYRRFTLRGLQEQIEAQLRAELADRPDILLEVTGEDARRALVRDVGEYVLAVEATLLPEAVQDALFDAAYRSLFSFGPLDVLLADESIIELVIDGYDGVYVRRRAGEPEAVPSPFEDAYEYARVLDRILTGAGAQLVESEPFIEIGLSLLGRPARLTLVGPPLSPVLHVDMRLHPSQAVTLEGLLAQGGITEADRIVLHALADSAYGALIIGDAAAGKTTLLQALLPHVPVANGAWLVERASELRVPPDWQHLAAQPAGRERASVEFSAQVAAALHAAPRVLALDEIRGDESAPLWEALRLPGGPRCLCVFRSSARAERLHSAFSIVVRKSAPTVEQAEIDRVLQERLPFVVAVRSGPEGLSVAYIAEWVMQPGGGRELLRLVQDGQPTRQHSRRALFPG